MGQFQRVVFPGVDPSERVCEKVAEQTDTVILSFSCGKDSIAAWLAIRPYFKKIIPYFLYIVPDLEFVETSLKYYEDFFETHIYRMPHTSWFRMLKTLTFQPPERIPVIDSFELGEVDYEELRDLVCDTAKIPRRTFDAKGTRAADSIMRRTNFKRRGGINYNRNFFFPVWDWRKEELVTRLKESGVKMPIDYALFGRSFDGIDFRFLYPIKENFPDDYARILEWFPLAELEIKRYEYATQKK
ncbi:MAG TPA: phosphoadenosine phosphosulfate reductase [Verrucomicrobiae bacterium]|nr:phosphoadenosine phosphosulfate reductase [Verrucomicrobiae bacterium]